MLAHTQVYTHTCRDTHKAKRLFGWSIVRLDGWPVGTHGGRGFYQFATQTSNSRPYFRACISLLDDGTIHEVRGKSSSNLEAALSQARTWNGYAFSLRTRVVNRFCYVDQSVVGRCVQLLLGFGRSVAHFPSTSPMPHSQSWLVQILSLSSSSVVVFLHLLWAWRLFVRLQGVLMYIHVRRLDMTCNVGHLSLQHTAY